jgi:glutaredoxin-related protein
MVNRLPCGFSARCVAVVDCHAVQFSARFVTVDDRLPCGFSARCVAVVDCHAVQFSACFVTVDGRLKTVDYHAVSEGHCHSLLLSSILAVTNK